MVKDTLYKNFKGLNPNQDMIDLHIRITAFFTDINLIK